MRIEVRKGNGRLVSSGVIILEKDDSQFSIEIEDLTVVIKFEDPGGEPNVEAGDQDAKLLTVRLLNFIDQLGISYIAPEIAFVGGERLSLSLFVKAMGTESNRVRTVTYTLMAQPND